MTDTIDLRRTSVTRDDGSDAPTGGPFAVLLGPAAWGGLLGGVQGATGLPPYPTWARDAILSETPHLEAMWANALGIAISKNAALGFTLEDDAESARRITRSQDLLLTWQIAGQANYTGALSAHLRDYLTTDNGAFIEIVRSSGAAGSRILGLAHLDSRRCYRTRDPSQPVVYCDVRGRYHPLDAENVIILADMVSPRAEHYGYGLCAASRVFDTILKLSAIETYVREKVSGARNLAIHFLTGISPKQLQDALSSSEEGAGRKGFVVYRGSTIIPILPTGGSEGPQVVTIPLAEMPDGFNAEQERKDAYLRYANAIGIALQELQPLSGQGLGTGTQSVIQDEMAEGRGLAAWRKAFTHAITHRVLPASTTFLFATNDTRDKQSKADVTKSLAETAAALVGAGVFSAQQALNWLVDKGEAPREFLPQDLTAGAALTDAENPVSEAEPVPVTPLALPAPVQPDVMAEKAAGLDALLDAELAAALDWARQVVGDG